LESDLKLLGEVHVVSEPSSAGTTVSISFKKASEKLRAKQVTTLRAVMKKIMKHSLNFNKLSAELKGTVAVKAVGVTQDPTLVPVKLSPVKAPPSKEVLTSPFLEKLKRLDKEAKDEEDAAKDQMKKRKAMEAESKAVVSDQLKEREEEENKVTPSAPKIEVEETDAEIEVEKTVKAMAAVVEEKKQVLLTVTSQREATKREVEKMDKLNLNTRKAMAEFAVKHDWPSYWDANASLTEDLEKRNAAKGRLLTEDRNVFASRKNLSLAQANETAALESMRVLRQEKKAALASHANDLAARQRAQLLKAAQTQTDLMNRLKEELKAVQAAAPRLGMTQNERLVWARNNENQQTSLTQQINNAEIRAEQLTAQASQNSS